MMEVLMPDTSPRVASSVQPLEEFPTYSECRDHALPLTRPAHRRWWQSTWLAKACESVNVQLL
jgi:hypothetical protein